MLNQDDVVYLIVVDRFCNGDPSNDGDIDLSNPQKRHGGDLLGITQRMPYLKDLGVTAVWISPMYVNPPDDYHGYHPLDFEKVDPHFCSEALGPSGSRETIRRFVEICHENGIKVMLDIIVSHTAENHPWLKERPDWFDEKASTLPEKYWLWGLPHLNQDNVNVNLYFAKNVMEWIVETGADAIRIDAARHVEKNFWRVLKLFAKGLCADVTIVGEVWDADPSVVAPYQDIYDFDSMFDYPLYMAMVDVFAKEQSIALIARPDLSPSEPEGILDRDQEYRNAWKLLTFIGNHDNPRFVSLDGNRGLEDGLAKMKLALTFLFTTRGIPQLYYGDELGMTGGPDPDNRRDMPWNLVDEEPTSKEAKNALKMREFLKALIRLRRSSKALCYGLLTTLYITPTIYAFTRTFLEDVRIVVINNGSEEAEVEIPIAVNGRLPVLVKRQLPDGLALIDELQPDGSDKVRIESGALKVSLKGKTAGIYAPT